VVGCVVACVVAGDSPARFGSKIKSRGRVARGHTGTLYANIELCRQPSNE